MGYKLRSNFGKIQLIAYEVEHPEQYPDLRIPVLFKLRNSFGPSSETVGPLCWTWIKPFCYQRKYKKKW